MTAFFLFFLTLIVLIFFIYYILNLNIGAHTKKNKLFIRISHFLPQATKNLIKKIFFPYKYFEYEYELQIEKQIKKLEQEYGFELTNIKKKNQNPIKDQKLLIKTDSQNCFEIKIDERIFIHKNKFKIKNIKIFAFLKDSKKDCISLDLSKNSQNSYIIHNENNVIIKAKYFFDNYPGAIFFQIIVDDFFYGYFSIDNKILSQQSKNLIIFPTTNFFNYNSNIPDINKYTSIQYVANLNEVPSTIDNTWHGIQIENDFYNSILNQSKIFKEFDILNDYSLEKINLENYKNIIFPLHQEYISEKMLEKLIKLVNNFNINIISIGGANFLNKIEFKFNNKILSNIIYFQDKNENINFKKYNLNTYNSNYNKDCAYKSDEDFLKNITFSGEVMDYKNNSNSESFFFNIISKTGTKLPVFTITNYKKGKLIQFNSDYVAVRFLQSKKLTNFFKSLL